MGLFLRPVRPEDMELLYQWANDPVTRQNGFHTEQISCEEHRQWFENVMRNEAVVIYICMEEDIPVGQIRLQINEREALISYSVDAEDRGRGVGTELLRMAGERLSKECPEVQLLKGEVKYGNTASMRAFEKNGYRREDGENCVVYRKVI